MIARCTERRCSGVDGHAGSIELMVAAREAF